jgi:hypothetical protein
MEMKFRAHESFFIRKGWLYKGLKNVRNSPDVFTSKLINPTDELGIGTNMVRSLRYWMQATGLTAENKSGTRRQIFTEFGDVIWAYDKYMEEMGTLWLLHYQLAKNKEFATSWYYFFNEFSMNEFDKDDFVSSLDAYVKMSEGYDGKEISLSSLESDFDCIIGTYVSRIKSNPEKVHPENNIDCPLGTLDLVGISDKKAKVYKKETPKKNMLNPLIVLAVIADNVQDITEIKISSILNDKCNVGKVFNLNSISLTPILDELQRMDLLKVNRTAGLDVVKLNTKKSFIEIVTSYYESLLK